MKNYEVLTCLHGLKRKDEARSRPIPPGEIVVLAPSDADRLMELGAIGETDGDATVELEREAEDGTEGGSAQSMPPIGVVAITDRYALVSAIEDLTGLVFFPGEGLPDDAEQVLADFSNHQLLDELTVRLSEGRLLPPEIPAALLPPVDAPSHSTEPKPQAAEQATVPAKATRKPKAAAK